jgi:hypothetical protein
VTNNTLSVPPVSYGAIPRTTVRTTPPQTDQGEPKRCFCGYYQEVNGGGDKPPVVNVYDNKITTLIDIYFYE